MRTLCKATILVAVLIFLIAGCATVTSPLGVRHSPSGKSGYVFGKFALIDTKTTFFTPYFIGIVLKSDDGREYGLKLVPETDNQYQIIEVQPGSYRIPESV